MDRQPIEIICKIFNLVPIFEQIQTLTIVCKRWNQIIKIIGLKQKCEDFQDFILNDQIYLYSTYRDVFQKNIIFMPYLCFPHTNLYKLIKSTQNLIVDRLNKIVKMKKTIKVDKYLFLYWLVKNKYLKLIKYLYKTDDLINSPILLTCINLAISTGDVSMIQYLCELNSNYDYCYKYIEDACFLGRMDMFIFLNKKFELNPDELHKIINLAFCSNNYEMIEFYHEQNKYPKCLELSYDDGYDKEFYFKIAQLLTTTETPNNLNIFDLIINNNINLFTKIKILPTDIHINYILRFALVFDRIDMIKHMCENKEFLVYVGDESIRFLFISALHVGDMNIILYLYEKYKLLLKIPDNHYIEHSSHSGNLDLVKFLFSEGFTIDNITRKTHQSLLVNSKNIIQIIKYIHDDHPKIKIDNDFLLYMCVKYGNPKDLAYFKNIKKVKVGSQNFFMSAALLFDNYDMLNYLNNKL